jgi:hypothetical protein
MTPKKADDHVMDANHTLRRLRASLAAATRDYEYYLKHGPEKCFTYAHGVQAGLRQAISVVCQEAHRRDRR